MERHVFTELLAQHKDRIYSVALYSLRDPHEAEDVTQEAFLKLWDRYAEIDPEKVGGWLTRVTHNLCIDHARRRRAQRNNFGQPDPDAVDHLVAEQGPAADPSLGVVLDERQRRLLAALDTLTPETRTVMMMHYFQDMKLHEIGEALGKSVSALKVQIHRARKSLRSALTAAEIPPQARRGIG
ncbi:sigma-70 family RNA polymerase sigma factor [bacterium]|nr:sigma-70 family RNA polymerase sigma factor [bacterium]